MDTIKLLNSLEVGTPLVVTTTYQDMTMREITLFCGANDDGTYNFIDCDCSYRMTPRYIKEHCTISQELDQENDLYELAQLTDKVKREGVK